MIPIKNGACSVPQLIKEPSQAINAEMDGPMSRPMALPDTMQTKGVIRISTFVLPLTNLPIYTATMAPINAPKGSPGPANCITPSTSTVPAMILEANALVIPAVAADTTTNGLAFNLCATPTPIPAPVRADATFPIITRY